VLAHLPQGFWPILNGGEAVLLFLVIFLYLMAHGGAFSLDELLRRQQEDAQRQVVAT
jgi:putative oxidoreductase